MYRFQLFAQISIVWTCKTWENVLWNFKKRWRSYFEACCNVCSYCTWTKHSYILRKYVSNEKYVL